ncbi:hypothetical protein PV328_007674 [Microctonus aethiopoides]|uniref:Mutator-like transposase domain-containing protein n=1 Tax=Microctonus aethiopoides TaxID=144406 RepID=A0AA39F0S6_9HYME|nr:hypothetical protein PV328_007674 [Microctonus aethiopoides]
MVQVIIQIAFIDLSFLSQRKYILYYNLYDFGWSKVGFTSKTGRGSVFGVLSEKILAADAFTVGCGMCARGHDKSDHECCINWSGSSKAMEAAMGVELMLENKLLNEAKVKVETFIGDDDACTYAAVQRQAFHKILKLSDGNHVRKKFESELYKLSLSYEELNAVVIPYLKKCFKYVLDQHKHSAEDATKALLNIVDNVYGEHDNCGDWFCTTDNKIAHGGSSQPNESFNHMVVMKYPKSRHYAETNAYKYRTAAAACQKNLGVSYMKEVYTTVGLSVSDNMIKFSSRRDAQRKKRVVRQSLSGNFNNLTDVIDENYTTESPLVVVDIETTIYSPVKIDIKIGLITKSSKSSKSSNSSNLESLCQLLITPERLSTIIMLKGKMNNKQINIKILEDMKKKIDMMMEFIKSSSGPENLSSASIPPPPPSPPSPPPPSPPLSPLASPPPSISPPASIPSVPSLNS